MAIPTENVGTDPFLISEIHIEAIQTIVPAKPINQKQSFRLQFPKTPFCGNFQRNFQIIIYHKVLEKAYSGWVVAGWFKESLGKALEQEPIFAGRLKILENDDNDGEHLELVTTDSGVRMIEANLEMINLDEFLDLKTKVEAGLVYWEDINEKNPQFSPLFFVQVTNFKYGGFSIGISCSLLVADPLSILRFIAKWSDIHKKIVSSTITPNTPLFYLPNLGRTGWSTPLKNHSYRETKTAQTMSFQIELESFDFEDNNMLKNIVGQCLDEVEQKLGNKLGISNISLYLKERSGNVKIVSLTIEEVDEQKKSTSMNKYVFSNWDLLKVGEEYFSVGRSNQSNASSWIQPVSGDDGFVMVIQSLPESSLRMSVIIMVTTPS